MPFYLHVIFCDEKLSRSSERSREHSNFARSFVLVLVGKGEVKRMNAIGLKLARDIRKMHCVEPVNCEERCDKDHGFVIHFYSE